MIVGFGGRRQSARLRRPVDSRCVVVRRQSRSLCLVRGLRRTRDDSNQHCFLLFDLHAHDTSHALHNPRYRRQHPHSCRYFLVTRTMPWVVCGLWRVVIDAIRVRYTSSGDLTGSTYLGFEVQTSLQLARLLFLQQLVHGCSEVMMLEAKQCHLASRLFLHT